MRLYQLSIHIRTIEISQRVRNTHIEKFRIQKANAALFLEKLCFPFPLSLSPLMGSFLIILANDKRIELEYRFPYLHLL